MVLLLPDSWSQWNLEVSVFEHRGKPEYPVKNLSEQRREPTTTSTHIWRRRCELNPGHTKRRRVFSPLRHPYCPFFRSNSDNFIELTKNLTHSAHEKFELWSWPKDTLKSALSPPPPELLNEKTSIPTHFIRRPPSP